MYDEHDNAWKAMPHRFKHLLKIDKHEHEHGKHEHDHPHLTIDTKMNKPTALITKVLTVTTTNLDKIRFKDHDFSESHYQPDQAKRVNDISLQKFKSAGQFPLEKQLHLHKILLNFNHKKNTMDNMFMKRGRQTRYLVMLNSVPMVNGVHPITAVTNKRKPYKETMKVTVAKDDIPVNSLLDPTTLHANFYTRTSGGGVIVEEVCEWKGWGFLAKYADWDY